MPFRTENLAVALDDVDRVTLLVRSAAAVLDADSDGEGSWRLRRKPLHQAGALPNRQSRRTGDDRITQHVRIRVDRSHGIGVSFRRARQQSDIDGEHDISETVVAAKIQVLP